MESALDPAKRLMQIFLPKYGYHLHLLFLIPKNPTECLKFDAKVLLMLIDILAYSSQIECAAMVFAS